MIFTLFGMTIESKHSQLAKQLFPMVSTELGISICLIGRGENIYSFTHVGFDGEQDKEHNQDISFIEKNFSGNSDYLFMSVCDGHGV